MYRTILWATDGSEQADDALPFARELARLTGAKIVAVHAAGRFGAGRAAGEPILAGEPELEEHIHAQAKALADAGFTVDVRIEHGQGAPGTLIARAADDCAADVIVVGTRGHGPVVGAVTGSVTQHLLHDAHCPVLAVPPQLAVRSSVYSGVT
jgi:nucleotide-binding universal stress UspA family protein